MKRVLILTVTAGNGHNSAAYAMKNKLEQMGKAEVKVVDIIKEYTSYFNSWIVDKGYNIAVGYLRPLYDLFYNAYFKYPIDKASVCPPQVSVQSCYGQLLKLIYEFKPDVIYTTTYYGGMVLTNLRRVYKLPCFTVACMLDYVVSPFWEPSIGGVDILTMAHEDNRNVLLSRGFKNENLLLTGIPVSDKFSVEIDKIKAREMLGIDKDLFTVFILYGGGHWSGSYEILKKLLKGVKKNIQIIIGNGKNVKTKERIDREMKNYPKNFKIVNYGFVNNIDVIMSAADVVVGKGGGLSTTEAVNKGLPIIATYKLPGQEYYNIKFLKDKGVALSFKNYKELVRHINYLHDSEDVLNRMKANMKELKTTAIDVIADLIVSQPEADYDGINTILDYNKVNKIVNRARKERYKEIKRQRKNKK